MADNIERNLDALGEALAGELPAAELVAALDAAQRGEGTRDAVRVLTNLARVLPSALTLPTPPDGHIEADEIIAYLAGRLPGARVAELEQHLSECRTCLQLLWDVRNVAAAYDAHVARAGDARRCEACGRHTPRPNTRCSWCGARIAYSVWSAIGLGVCLGVPAGLGIALVVASAAGSALMGESRALTAAVGAALIGVAAVTAWVIRSRTKAR